MKPVVHSRVVHCAAERAAVWRLVTDTDRLNRLAGLPPIEQRTESDGKGPPRILVKSSFYGIDVEYEERPFQWTEGERFSIERLMLAGPLQSLEMTFELSDAKGGTDCELRLSLLPASLLFVPVARMVSKVALSKLVKALKQVDRRLSSGRWEPAGRAQVDGGLLRRADEVLARMVEESSERLETRDVLTELAGRLVELVSLGRDHELHRIRPYELAEVWGAGPRQALTLCLYAVRAGLLELRWDLVCPSCRTTSGRLDSLSQLSDAGHCGLCDIRFELDLDRSVEATFMPASALRPLADVAYCTGGPGRTPHVVSQVVLDADGQGMLMAPAKEGRYRVFVRGGASALVEVSGGASEAVCFEREGDAVALAPAQASVAPGGRIEVRWASGGELHAKLEHLEWASNAATAHQVSTLPAFRRQFSQEVLHPGLSLKVGRVSILFSDLTGSTELYTRMGDAIAFRLVQDHFDLLGNLIDEHQGTIVKTIGDAVMAAFADEANAVRAAVAMLEAFPAFASEHEHAQGLSLKLGAHTGACYAVTANNLLDYFGQTVNVAARLQGQAGGAELVLSDEVADRALAEGWLENVQVVERYDADLKGLARPLRATRLRWSSS